MRGPIWAQSGAAAAARQLLFPSPCACAATPPWRACPGQGAARPPSPLGRAPLRSCACAEPPRAMPLAPPVRPSRRAARRLGRRNRAMSSVPGCSNRRLRCPAVEAMTTTSSETTSRSSSSARRPRRSAATRSAGRRAPPNSGRPRANPTLVISARK